VLVVGDGSERERIEALLSELGLEDTVTLLGMRSDVPDLVRAFDVAVLSSDFEGTPLAIMEYMEAEKPVVATRVGGVPDLIAHGVHGLLVSPQDPGALAASVAELLRDPARAAEMGRRGGERRRREFDLDATVRRLEELYERLYAASARTYPGRVKGSLDAGR
jgi:glycosyltransferase involved in cell wall biosynthesis